MSDQILMPRRLTAENGAKGLLVGEFKAHIELGCPCVDDDEANDDCELCDGDGSYLQPVAIDWDTIKAIYAKAADGLGIALPSSAELRAELPLYYCRGKGGHYELIGHAKGAGYNRGQQVVVYRDPHSGELFHRSLEDFEARMAPVLADLPEGIDSEGGSCD